MYQPNNEIRLIITDIVSVMGDYVSIQPDIDELKIKSSLLVAQRLDVQRAIGKENVERCIEPQSEADDALVELVIPPLCYFTYYRALLMHQGTLTDGGYTTETEADERNSAKSQANHFYSIAEAFLADVIEYLEAEKPEEPLPAEPATPRIRVFGGEENRSSN